MAAFVEKFAEFHTQFMEEFGPGSNGSGQQQ